MPRSPADRQLTRRLRSLHEFGLCHRSGNLPGRIRAAAQALCTFRGSGGILRQINHSRLADGHAGLSAGDQTPVSDDRLLVHVMKGLGTG